MPTTIQISDRVRKTLEEMKLANRESYNDVIERMLEDHAELNDATKREIAAAEKRIRAGKFTTQEDVERMLR